MEPKFPITLTEKAIKAIHSAMEEAKFEAHDTWLYVGVRGGGCSGLQYVLDFCTGPQTDDWLTEEGTELKLCTDPISAGHLEGTTIDYESGLQGTGFKFINPNAQRHCGCGQSFS